MTRRSSDEEEQIGAHARGWSSYLLGQARGPFYLLKMPPRPRVLQLGGSVQSTLKGQLRASPPPYSSRSVKSSANRHSGLCEKS